MRAPRTRSRTRLTGAVLWEALPPPDGRPTVLHTVWGSDIGGAERLCLQLCRALTERGWRAAVVAVGGGGPISELAAQRGLPWYCIPERTSVPRRLGILRGIVTRCEPDLLHSHFLGDDSYTRFVALITRVPIVATLHNTYPKEPWHRRLQKEAARIDIRRLACISDGVATVARDSYHFPQDRIRIVQNSIDFSRFEISARHSRSGQMIIGCAGRLTEQKGQDLLLRAVASLPDPGRYRVLFAGAGALRNELETLAQRLGIADSVDFLGSLDDMSRFYERLDVLVMPSRWEGFGLVAVEAMASGVPVIGSDVPGLREVLGVSDLNSIWPIGDIDALAHMIQASAETPLSDDERLGLRHAVEQQFSSEAMIDGYQRLYAEILNEGS